MRGAALTRARAAPYSPLRDRRQAFRPTAKARPMNAPVTPPAKAQKLIKGATGDWEVIVGMEIHAQVTSRGEAVLGRLDRLRGRAERPRLPRRRRHARHAAGHQRGMRAPGGPHRPRPEGRDQPALGLRPQELLLPRPAAGLPDQPVQEPDRRRGRGHGRRAATARPSPSASSACTSSRTPASRCTTSIRP